MSTRTGHAYAYCVRVRVRGLEKSETEKKKKKTRGTYAGLIHGKRKNKLNRTLNKKPKSIT